MVITFPFVYLFIKNLSKRFEAIKTLKRLIFTKIGEGGPLVGKDFSKKLMIKLVTCIAPLFLAPLNCF